MGPIDIDMQRFGLGPIDQLSFAVRSVDEAAPRYAAMFGGPYMVFDVPDLDVVVGGEPTRTSLRLGIGRNGSLEIELVEVLEGGWPTVQWLDENGEGPHHIRFPVADVATTRDQMLDAGFEMIMASADGTSFMYLTSPLLNGMTIELIGTDLL